ncbi:hypothetical protein MKY34_00225 [Sporosarcina sp. FSL K6-1522]|uniref:hypothetical protein n=1 Tax=Sporosarcina sp. FSL K6-1522 TaxID=2921554 RepID=UPI003159E8CD
MKYKRCHSLNQGNGGVFLWKNYGARNRFMEPRKVAFEARILFVEPRKVAFEARKAI